MFAAPSLAVRDGDEATSASAAGSGPATVSTTAAAATDTTVRHRRNAVLLMCSFPSQASDEELFMNRAFRAVPSRSMIHVDSPASRGVCLDRERRGGGRYRGVLAGLRGGLAHHRELQREPCPGSAPALPVWDGSHSRRDHLHRSRL